VYVILVSYNNTTITASCIATKNTVSAVSTGGTKPQNLQELPTENIYRGL